MDLGLGDTVLDGDPAFPPSPTERGTAAPTHTFRSMSIVAKRLPISATAELLLIYAIANRHTDRQTNTDIGLQKRLSQWFAPLPVAK